MFPKIVGFPPKSSILIGISIINHPFWGTTIFGNIQWRNLEIWNLHQDKVHQADRRVAFGVSDSSVFWRWKGSFEKDYIMIYINVCIDIIIYHNIHQIYIIYIHCTYANPPSVCSMKWRFCSGSTKNERILVLTGILGVSLAIPLESHETLFSNQKNDRRFRTWGVWHVIFSLLLSNYLS